METQRVAALLAALLAYEEVTPEMIEIATARACDAQVGDPIGSLAVPRYPSRLVEAFVLQQAARLAR